MDRLRRSPQARKRQQREQQQRRDGVANRPGCEIHRDSPPRTFCATPSSTTCTLSPSSRNPAPCATTRSRLFTPERISMSLPVRRPTSTRCLFHTARRHRENKAVPVANDDARRWHHNRVSFLEDDATVDVRSGMRRAARLDVGVDGGKRVSARSSRVRVGECERAPASCPVVTGIPAGPGLPAESCGAVSSPRHSSRSRRMIRKSSSPAVPTMPGWALRALMVPSSGATTAAR